MHMKVSANILYPFLIFFVFCWWGIVLSKLKQFILLTCIFCWEGEREGEIFFVMHKFCIIINY